MKTAKTASALFLIFTLHSSAYLRGTVTDEEAVTHAQVIIIGHLKSSSLVKSPKGQFDTSASAVLVVSDVLKAPFLIEEIPIEIDHGLTPFVGGDIRYLNTKTGVGIPDENIKVGEIKIYDTGNSQFSDFPITGDLNQDQIWLLRVCYDGKGIATKRLRVWDPEDIQPLSKKEVLSRLILTEKDGAREKIPKVEQVVAPNGP
jgi:hypothetical protein